MSLLDPTEKLSITAQTAAKTHRTGKHHGSEGRKGAQDPPNRRLNVPSDPTEKRAFWLVPSKNIGIFQGPTVA